jgi:glutamate formiminotransferase
MNLTNYSITPVARAFEAVKAAAEHEGVAVFESEIIGLVPAAALAGTTPALLQLRGFSPRQLLDNYV